MAITLDQVRMFAMGLPAVTEEPHHAMTSFRVKGRIFATSPPDGLHLHVFVEEQEREKAMAIAPEAFDKLFWGAKVVGLRVTLAKARTRDVQALLRSAWRRKAPRGLAVN